MAVTDSISFVILSGSEGSFPPEAEIAPVAQRFFGLWPQNDIVVLLYRWTGVHHS